MSKARQCPRQRRCRRLRAGQSEDISGFNAVQIGCEMDLSSHRWTWHVLLPISICCPASSSGRAACNSEHHCHPSHFPAVQFEIRGGGGRVEAKTQPQVVPSAHSVSCGTSYGPSNIRFNKRAPSSIPFPPSYSCPSVWIHPGPELPPHHEPQAMIWDRNWHQEEGIEGSPPASGDL